MMQIFALPVALFKGFSNLITDASPWPRRGREWLSGTDGNQLARERIVGYTGNRIVSPDVARGSIAGAQQMADEISGFSHLEASTPTSA